MSKVKLTVLMILILGISSSNLFAQNYLDGPESVAFDSVGNQYLVTSMFNNRIVSIDTNGVQTIWKELAYPPSGNCIVENILYVTNNRTIYGYDLTTSDLVLQLSPTGWTSLGGLAVDTSGNLYVVSGNSGQLYKLRLSDNSPSVFVTSGISNNTQDIFFDERGNRILICTYASNHPIKAVDLDDSTNLYTYLSPCPGFSDGITIDQFGNVYVSVSTTGEVILYDSTGTNPYQVVSTGNLEPSGIDYNIRDNILAIPNFVGDSVVFLKGDIPSLKTVGQILVDPVSDSNTHANAGETVDLSIKVRNDRWNGNNVIATLSTDDTFVTMNSSSVPFLSCDGWGTVSISPSAFNFSIDPSTPDPHIILFELTLTADNNYISVDTLYVFVGETVGFVDDIESMAPYWSTTAGKNGYGNEWHIDDFRSFSSSNSWKVGGQGVANYSDSLDAILISPPFLLPARPTLTLWYYMDSEYAGDPSQARDGGQLLIGNGDGNWTEIIPEFGYGATIVSSQGSPFDLGTPVFSSASSWRYVKFDLSGYDGLARLMFRFGSDRFTNQEGWYIDDINVYYGGCCFDPTGDFDGSDEINVVDLTAFVDFLFRGGANPACDEEADMDGNSEININDLTTLINYLFRNGSEPLPCL